MPLKNAYSEEFEQSSLLVHLDICNAKVRTFTFLRLYKSRLKWRYGFSTILHYISFRFPDNHTLGRGESHPIVQKKEFPRQLFLTSQIVRTILTALSWHHIDNPEAPCGLSMMALV